MKRFFGVLSIAALFLSAFVGCSDSDKQPPLWSRDLFNSNGIYANYDELSAEDKEKFLSEAQGEGYSLGMSEDGRVTLEKDGDTLILGRSQSTTKETEIQK